MLYLTLAILSSAGIAILIKIYRQQGRRAEVLIASNYILAMVLGWIFLWTTAEPWSVSAATFWLGLGGGLLWPSAFYLYTWGIAIYGLSLTGAISRLALVIPILFGIFFLSEHLTLRTGVGILTVGSAFILHNPVKVRMWHSSNWKAVWYFPVLVLIFGFVDLWVNLFNHLGPRQEQFVFLTLLFSFSMLFSWLAVAVQRLKVTTGDFWTGLTIGVPNFFTSYFLLESLKSPFFAEHSAIAYTLYSAVGVLLVFCLGAIIWREKITRGHLIGIALAVTAIVLLSDVG